MDQTSASPYSFAVFFFHEVFPYLVHFLVVGRHADECPAQAQSAKRGGDEEEEWSSLRGE